MRLWGRSTVRVRPMRLRARSGGACRSGPTVGRGLLWRCRRAGPRDSCLSALARKPAGCRFGRMAPVARPPASANRSAKSPTTAAPRSGRRTQAIPRARRTSRERSERNASTAKPRCDCFLSQPAVGICGNGRKSEGAKQASCREVRNLLHGVPRIAQRVAEKDAIGVIGVYRCQ